jgi:putative transposase
MARPLRIQFPGAWYHVMNRGGARRIVFHRDADRALFLGVVEETSIDHGLEVHGYCLMGNHYHLLVCTPRGNLAQAMRHIDGVYTQRINRRDGADGALFRGRYRAILLDEDAYLLAVSRYIHLNPVAAHLVVAAQDYPWSSYSAYLSRSEGPEWLHTRHVLTYFGPHDARRRYQCFVNQGVDEELEAFYTAASVGPVLGTQTFIDSLAVARLDDPEIPQRHAFERVPEISRIIEVVSEVFGVPTATVVRADGQRNDARAVAIWLCRRPGGLALRPIAHHFGLSHYTAVSVTCRRLRERLEQDKTLAMRLEVARVRLVHEVSGVKT